MPEICKTRGLGLNVFQSCLPHFRSEQFEFFNNYVCNCALLFHLTDAYCLMDIWDPCSTIGVIINSVKKRNNGVKWRVWKKQLIFSFLFFWMYHYFLLLAGCPAYRKIYFTAMSRTIWVSQIHSKTEKNLQWNLDLVPYEL